MSERISLPQRSKLIGLTGGIACGKSAVSRLLHELGARVVDADLIARQVVSLKSEGLTQIVARWGEEVLDAQGALDRARLGEIIFKAPAERQVLEAIIHPLIALESARQIQQAMNIESPPPLVVYDAALLIESGRVEMFRPLVVVTTSSEIQRARLQQRDQLSSADAQSRIDAQMPLSQKEALADFVIDNRGDWSDLNFKVNALWQALICG
jgi:dephospho-CoA kinase